MQQIMVEKGIFKEFEESQKSKRTGKVQTKKRASRGMLNEVEQAELNNSYSETTIYKPAIEKQQMVDPEISFKLPEERRGSSSSEEQIDTSDELMDVDNFIADCEAAAKKDRVNQSKSTYRREDMVREAEAGKARAMATPGNENVQAHIFDMSPEQFIDAGGLNRQQANVVDENYMLMGNVEETLKLKIINNEYVDLARLLPKDRLSREEDHRMELISKGGATFFVPVADREVNSNAIFSFQRWEQAFRVFSNIYTRAYPERAAELIQYNQLIYTASLSFTWDNVYRYDREFRMHLSNYPQRNWSVILQQAWSLYLKDRINVGNCHMTNNKSPGGGQQHSNKKKEICKRFNRGQCTRGLRCHYEHRCLECGKFGHGEHICRNKNKGVSEASKTKDTK